MNGDPLARQRCRSIARWLCRSGVRMAEGPARGAFFSSQRFPNAEPVKLDKRGCTQASTEILPARPPASALWTLLFYRHVTGENDPEINRVIDEAAQWLLKTQTPDGGWPYGHTVDGKPSPGAPSGGNIWNIWALWRLGKETGEAKYIEAAERGKQWYLKTFVEPHHYHGYWEDVGPASGKDMMPPWRPWSLPKWAKSKQRSTAPAMPCNGSSPVRSSRREGDLLGRTGLRANGLAAGGLLQSHDGLGGLFRLADQRRRLLEELCHDPKGDRLVVSARHRRHGLDRGCHPYGAVGGPGLRELVERLVHRPIGYADAPLAGPGDEPAIGGQTARWTKRPFAERCWARTFTPGRLPAGFSRFCRNTVKSTGSGLEPATPL